MCRSVQCYSQTPVPQRVVLSSVIARHLYYNVLSSVIARHLYHNVLSSVIARHLYHNVLSSGIARHLYNVLSSVITSDFTTMCCQV